VTAGEDDETLARPANVQAGRADARVRRVTRRLLGHPMRAGAEFGGAMSQRSKSDQLVEYLADAHPIAHVAETSLAATTAH
jgi:hypothetical protein